MSTAVIAAPRGHVTQGHVVRSEWTKFWSLRSTRWSMFASILVMVAFGALVAAVQMNRWAQLDPRDLARFDSIDIAVGGYHLAQLAVGVLGVLVISGEYTTGMIRSSFMAVPKRLPVFWAKLLVFASVTFVLMIVSAFLAFFI